MPEEKHKVLFILIVCAGIVLLMVFAPHQKNEPKAPLTMESVGKKVGEKSTRFGKGFVKGVWKEVKGDTE